MPNITISLDEKLYLQARIYATSHGTTVTQLLREFLQETLKYGIGDNERELEYILNRYPGLFRIALSNFRSQSTATVGDEPGNEPAR